jgi:hypothetical protein
MRIKKAGYDGSPSGENCANYPSAPAAVFGWLHSPGHHRNIASRGSNELGSGYAGVYTCTFGRSKTNRLSKDLKLETKRWPISYKYYKSVFSVKKVGGKYVPVAEDAPIPGPGGGKKPTFGK